MKKKTKEVEADRHRLPRRTLRATAEEFKKQDRDAKAAGYDSWTEWARNVLASAGEQES